MECPGCHQKIGVFSKTTNKFGKKACPGCGKALKFKVDLKKYTLIALPLIFIAQFVLAGIIKALAVGIVAGLAAWLSMKVIEA